MKTLYQTRLNKLILFAHAITTFFLTVGLMAQLMSSGLPPMKSVPQIVLNLLVFIGGVVVFIKFKTTVIYTRYVGIAFAVVYFFILALIGWGSTKVLGAISARRKYDVTDVEYDTNIK